MRDELRRLPPWLGLACSTAAVVIALSYFMTGQRVCTEAVYALLLLAINLGFFLLAAWIPARGGGWASPQAGLFLVVNKLFVNTFTIFLFIGLQAVQSAVFVPLFFSGYLFLLAGSVCLLNRKP